MSWPLSIGLNFHSSCFLYFDEMIISAGTDFRVSALDRLFTRSSHRYVQKNLIVSVLYDMLRL